MLKRYTLLFVLLAAAFGQYGCGALAAGAVGAAAGHEAAEDDED